MRKLIFYSLFITVIVFSGLFLPVTASATSAPKIEYVPLAPLDVQGSTFRTGTSCVAPTCFPKYLRTIYNVGIALAGFFAVFSIVNGGFTLLFTDSILGHSEGKAMILRALGGLVIVYSSYIFMNQISPSLGRDLDLSLAFERVPKAETRRGLTVVDSLTTQQLKQLDNDTERVRAENKATVVTKTGELTTLKESLVAELAKPAAEQDPEAIVQLKEDITTKEGQIAALNLNIKGTSEERLVTTHGLNAQTAEEAQKNLVNATKAGGSLEQIHTAYSEYRTALQENKPAVIRSYTEEFNRTSSAQKGLAFGILENPPLLPGFKREDAYDSNGVIGTAYIDDAALTSQIAERVQAIKTDREKQVLALTNLNPSLDRASQTILKGEVEKINKEASDQIAQIKNLCQVNGYECGNLEPGRSR